LYNNLIDEGPCVCCVLCLYLYPWLMWNFLHSADQLILLILAHNWDPWLMWNFLHSTDQLILLVLAHNWDPWLMWNFLHSTDHLILLVLAHNWDPRVVRSTSWQVDDWLMIGCWSYIKAWPCTLLETTFG
jgi:hypothetical protein